MTQLDPLAPGARPTPDASGTDRSGALRLTLDSARDIRRVEVLDPGRLRTPEAFDDALRESFGAADGNRALAVLEAEGLAEEYLQRAEATLAGRTPVRVPTRPDVRRDAIARRRELREVTGALRRTPYPRPVTSDNGYLTVQRGSDGRLVGVSVDREWLGGARREHLESALEQALRLPSRAREV